MEEKEFNDIISCKEKYSIDMSKIIETEDGFILEDFDPSAFKKLITPCWINQSKEENAKMHEFDCLWDTGASQTIISPGVAKNLGLLELKTKTPSILKTVKEIVHTDVYRINIMIPGTQLFTDVVVGSYEFKDDPFDILIGMDIITKGEFLITKEDGASIFSFQRKEQ